MLKLKRILYKIVVWFFGLSVLLVVFFKFVPVPFTPLMGIRIIENKLDKKPIYFEHNWEPIENISMNLQKAVIASEDGTFLHHHGFDFSAMQQAFRNNANGKKIKGI